MSDSNLENAETIASPVSGLPAGDSINGRNNAVRNSSGAISAAARGFVRLVEGSQPHLSSETRKILRERLLIAASLFLAGFFVFLMRNLMVNPVWSGIQGVVLYTHMAVTVAMGLLVLWLAKVKEHTTTRIYVAELLTFGIPACLFTLISLANLSLAANLKQGAFLPIIVVPWMILIFTYALFIPNTWKRSLWVIVPFGLLPIAIAHGQNQICSGMQNCIAQKTFANYHTQQDLVMLLTMVIAVVGVYTINNLRREAFEAKQLGQYRLAKRIGSGGMGEVYLAEHQMMKRPCAIKVIRPEKAGDPHTLARFEREVRMTAKLSHWNSVDIYDYGNAEDGTFYYVMEYLPGHNTGELVTMAGPLSPARVVYLMDQVCRALSEAHNMGLVHRDLKPANIFCALRGGQYDVAKLLDFGLAKPTVTAAVNEAELTQEGAITGSPMFMSPEQATGEREADVRSDIYSLGCVLYFLLTGRAPFDYKQSVKVIIAHASEEVLPLRNFNESVPIDLEEIVLQCLEKDPKNRFQTVEELRIAMSELDLEDIWSAEMAAEWWNCNGCPQRKAFDAAAMALV